MDWLAPSLRCDKNQKLGCPFVPGPFWMWRMQFPVKNTTCVFDVSIKEQQVYWGSLWITRELISLENCMRISGICQGSQEIQHFSGVWTVSARSWAWKLRPCCCKSRGCTSDLPWDAQPWIAISFSLVTHPFKCEWWLSNCAKQSDVWHQAAQQTSSEGHLEPSLTRVTSWGLCGSFTSSFSFSSLQPCASAAHSLGTKMPPKFERHIRPRISKLLDRFIGTWTQMSQLKVACERKPVWCILKCWPRTTNKFLQISNNSWTTWSCLARLKCSLQALLCILVQWMVWWTPGAHCMLHSDGQTWWKGWCLCLTLHKYSIKMYQIIIYRNHTLKIWSTFWKRHHFQIGRWQLLPTIV